MSGPDIVALARALVLALFPAFARAILAGIPSRAVFDAAWEAHGAQWRAEHGPDVAREAAATLDELGPADVLIKHRTLAWMERGPIAPLPLTPVEGMLDPHPPPVEAIAWWRRLWRSGRGADPG